MAYIITDECLRCGACAKACPLEAIAKVNDKYVIDAHKCISCGTCAGVCPIEASIEE